MMHTLLELIAGLFKLRNCNLALSAENISRKKFRVCLEYHVGNCLGPCEGFQREEAYDESIRQVREILKGNLQSVIRYLNGVMQTHAAAFEYEEAQFIKEKIGLIEQYQSKSLVAHPSINNVDVFAIVDREQSAYVNFLKISNGAVIQAHTVELKKKLDEPQEELLAIAIMELRNRYNSNATEVLVNIAPDLRLEGVSFVIPKIGDKKHLVNLAVKNLFYYIREQESRLEKLDPEHRTNRIMSQMQADLRMTEQPRYIECFDNSNIQGAYPVAAMSVFRDGKPSKSEYRHFNIETVTGPDDFASMGEVITRRYTRLLKENLPLPQLVVIDGGKGQLSAAVGSLKKLGIYGKLTVIGIAKKLEEIYFPNDPVPIYLDKKGETLRVIQHIRDEVHRFGITHHRNRRSKALTSSSLSDISGIGSATATSLLRHFRSLKRIREASQDELEVVVGKAKARAVFSHFRETGSGEEAPAQQPPE
jgi:excinuclease ABC subunit C